MKDLAFLLGPLLALELLVLSWAFWLLVALLVLELSVTMLVMDLVSLLVRNLVEHLF